MEGTRQEIAVGTSFWVEAVSPLYSKQGRCPLLAQSGHADCPAMSAFGGKADMGGAGSSRRRLREHPGSISYDPVVGACRVSGVAQRESPDLQATASRFQQETS